MMPECSCETGSCDRHAKVLTGRLLELYKTRGDYRESFDRRYANLQGGFSFTRCIHRAGASPEVWSCGCTVYQCEIYGECTLTRNAMGIRVCWDCEDRNPGGID